jgi:hypothetical protein
LNLSQAKDHGSFEPNPYPVKALKSKKAPVTSQDVINQTVIAWFAGAKGRNRMKKLQKEKASQTKGGA